MPTLPTTLDFDGSDAIQAAFLAVDEALRGAARGKGRRDLGPGRGGRFRRRDVAQVQEVLQRGLGLVAVHRTAVLDRGGVVLVGVDAPVVDAEGRRDGLDVFVPGGGVAGMRLARRAPRAARRSPCRIR